MVPTTTAAVRAEVHKWPLLDREMDDTMRVYKRRAIRSHIHQAILSIVKHSWLCRKIPSFDKKATTVDRIF